MQCTLIPSCHSVWGRTDHKGCSYSSTCFLQHFAVAVHFSWLQLASNQDGVDLLIELSPAGNNVVQFSIGTTLQVPEIIKIYSRYVCSVHNCGVDENERYFERTQLFNCSNRHLFDLTYWLFTNSLSVGSSCCVAFFTLLYSCRFGLLPEFLFARQEGLAF